MDYKAFSLKKNAVKKGIALICFILFWVVIVMIAVSGSPKARLIDKWEFSEGELEIEGYVDDLRMRDEYYYKSDLYGNTNSKELRHDCHATIQFRKNGTYFFQDGDKMVSETYSIHDNSTIVLHYQGVDTTFSFSVDTEFDKLTMTNGSYTAVLYKAD